MVEKILNVWGNNKGIITKVLIGAGVVVGLKLVVNAIGGSSDTEEDYIDGESSVVSEEVIEA